METGRKIYIVSPKLPCGTTWLINCLLELGVKTYRLSAENMWVTVSGGHLLHPREDHLKRHLPSLMFRDRFVFQEDLEVEWTHEWRTAKFKDQQVIYFIRDPRDALYSWYKRLSPTISYREYAAVLDSYTLLDQIDNWCLYNEGWLAHDHLQLFRFEDYKQDAAALLREVLQFAGIEVNGKLLKQAIEASTFEKARQAEQQYKALNPGIKETVNRAGAVQSWEKLNEDDLKVASQFERRAGYLLKKFGYASQTNSLPLPDYRPNSVGLSFFRRVDLPPAIFERENEGDACERLNKIVNFANTLNVKESIEQDGEPFNTYVLLRSLAEICDNLLPETSKTVSTLNDLRLCLQRHKYEYYLYVLKNIFYFKRDDWRFIFNQVFRKLGTSLGTG